MGDRFDSEGLYCAFCQENLAFMSISGREAHYEQHFLDDCGAEETSIKPSYEPSLGADVAGTSSGAIESHSNLRDDTSTKYYKRAPWSAVRETDTFWYAENSSEPPRNFTPGAGLRFPTRFSNF